MSEAGRRTNSQAPDGLDAVPPTSPDPGSDAVPAARPSLRRRFAASLEQNWQTLVPAGGVLLVAVLLLTRFTVHAILSRDQAIYVYGAVRFSHGVPPYVSIFDPKTPGTTMLGGVAATFAHWFDLEPLRTIRWTFFAFTVATVLAVYAVAHRLWASVTAAVAAGLTMCCFTAFAQSGLVGPEAKMPGLFFSTLAMYLMIRRRWFWAAVCGGLAFDFWQPFVWFGLIAIIGGVLDAPAGRRWRTGLVTLAGAALPTLLLAIYFVANGALSEFLVAAFEYPLTGTKRGAETFTEHFTHVAKVFAHYPLTNVLAWTGTLLLIAFVVAAFVGARGHRRSVWRSPLVLIVFVTFVLNMGYAFFDFQSDPDTLPLLVYPALGIGGGAAFVVGVARSPAQRRAAVAGITAVALAAVSLSWVLYSDLSRREETLRQQLSDACGLSTLLGKHGELVSLGNPALFVLTQRVSPSNFIYLGAGVDDWKINHTAGGLPGWVHEILGPKPAIVAINQWVPSHKTHNPNVDFMRRYLRAAGYRRGYLGKWALWTDADTRRTARSLGIHLSRRPTREAMLTDGEPLPPRVPCEIQ